jgi:hypothetical protein
VAPLAMACGYSTIMLLVSAYWLRLALSTNAVPTAPYP